MVEEIRERGADYVICLKGNQQGLYDEAKALFDEALGHDFDDCVQSHTQTSEKGHGRTEVRDYWLVKDGILGGRKAEWRDLRSFGKVRSNVRPTARPRWRSVITSRACHVG